MIKTGSIVVAAVVSAFGLGACNAWTDTGQNPLAARILEVTANPNPVLVGDTTTLTVVHTDSLEGGFSYHWVGVDDGVETAEPQYRWRANVQPRDYFFAVRVSREGEYEDVQRSITVTVDSAQ